MNIILKSNILNNIIRSVVVAVLMAISVSHIGAQIAICPPTVLLPCDKINMNPKVYFELATPFYQTGDVISINLMAERFEYVNTLQFTLSFNACNLRYLGTKNATLQDFVMNEVSSESGNVAIIWFNSSGKGVCTETDAALLEFEFEVLEANADDNSITLSNNISEMEAGVTLDISAPTCSMSIDVDKFYLSNVCNELTTTIDVCNPEVNDDFAVIDISVCGGEEPFTISSNAFQTFQSPAFEFTKVLIDDIEQNSEIDIVITDNQGVSIDTSIQFSFVNPMEIEFTVLDPSCVNSSDGSIIIDTIIGGLKDDLSNYEVKWSNEVYSNFENASLANGDYSVTVIDQMGCELIEQFKLDTESLTIDDLIIQNSCDENGTVTFNITIPNPDDEIVQLLVRDVNFVNYPNELSDYNSYRNTNIPPQVYTITVFTQNGCSADTSFVMYREFTRIGGTLFVDENGNGDFDDEEILRDIPITLFECDGDDETPLFTFNTTFEGNYPFIIPPGIYKFGIHRDEFQLDGKLAQFDIANNAPSPQDDKDNDNNGYENGLNEEYALITDCVFVNCPENVTGASENMAIDIGLLRPTCAGVHDINDFSVTNCEALSQINPVCDLADISDRCFSLNESESVVSNTMPVCIDTETMDNAAWFSFVAPMGDIQLLVNPLSCMPGRCGELGMHMGVYTDCDLLNPVWCSEGPCVPSELSTPAGLFEPGVRYFFFVDGCGGALCDFELLTICNDPSCDPFDGITDVGELSVVACDGSESLCVTKDFEISLDNPPFGEAQFSWEIFTQFGEIVDSFNGANITELDLNFVDAGNYLVTLEISTECGSVERAVSFTIAGPSTVDFPTETICGPAVITPSFTDNDGNEYTWPNEISISPNNSNEIQEIILTDTLDTDCNCLSILNLQIDVLPDSSSVIEDINCLATSNSVEFIWADDENTAQYQITVLTGQSAIFNPLGPSLLVPGLQLMDSVAVEILAINNTDCGMDTVVTVSCIADGVFTDDIDDALVSIYPVPANDHLIIESDLNIQTVSILSKEGQLINRSAYNANRVDLYNYPSGVYILLLETDDGKLSYKRFIKL